MLGYPGYGRSEGSPSETALINAAKLSYAYLRDAGLTDKDLVLYGEPLGSAVAIQLAAQRSASALVLVAPLRSCA